MGSRANRGVIFTILFVLSSASVFGQGSIGGTVIDRETVRPLPGVNVYLLGTAIGTVTDRDGMFRIGNVPRGTFTLVVSMIGYVQYRQAGVRVEGGEMLRVDIELEPAILETDPVIVTAAKSEQSLRDVPTSVSVLHSQEIDRRNVFTIDEALRYVPGVHINLSQINIRGSSGYSHGAGSRVLLLVDGIPVLSGDTGEITWEIIPVDQVERIEVIKGAGSTLYGSSALGGVVNIITRDLPDRPVSSIKTQGGFYDEPLYDAWKWSDRTRFKHHLGIAHGRRIGNLQIAATLGTFFDDGYRLNDSRRRTTGYIKGRYLLSPYQTLTLSGFFNDQSRQNFLYWRSFDQALEPFDEQRGEVVESFRMQSSVQYRHIYGSETFLTMRGSLYHTDFTDNIGEFGNASRANVYSAEIQYNRSLSESHYLVTGVEGSVQTVGSDIFGDRSGFTVAVYGQDEWRIGTQLRLTGGLRFDITRLDTNATFTNFSPRAGAVYSISPALSMRASAGAGFRAPSAAEAFATTAASGLIVSPNPGLEAERSWSFEAGVIVNPVPRINLDAAVFQNEYWDMIEPVVVDVSEEGIRAQFVNVLRARVRGFEAGINASTFDRLFQPRLGYTYMDGIDVDEQAPLKYRHKHMLTLSVLSQYGIGWFDINYRYLSKADRIDDELGFIIDRVDERVPIHVLDISAGITGYLAGLPVKLSGSIKNALQYHYIEFPGNIAPTRQYLMSLQVAI